MSWDVKRTVTLYLRKMDSDYKLKIVIEDMDYGNINMLYDKNIDSRSVSITVSYRFNSTTNKYKGQQSSDEINRL